MPQPGTGGSRVQPAGGFGRRLAEAVVTKRSPVCVGLDPVLDRLPPGLVEAARRRYGRSFEAAARAFLEFGCAIIDAVAPLAAAVKPQSAFYERYGHRGVWALGETVRHAHRRGLLVILDAKRADIGNTSEAYADAAIGRSPLPGGRLAAACGADAVTVNPYLGEEALRPFVLQAAALGKGLFLVVRTSNPGSDEIQEAPLAGGGRVCDLAAGLAARLNALAEGEPGSPAPGPDGVRHRGDLGRTPGTGPCQPGYGPVGVVVGANRPEEAARLREILPRAWFLLPGYGAQGAGAADVLPFFDPDGLGALVSASRSIIYAFASAPTGPRQGGPPPYALAARAAVERMLFELQAVTARYPR
ncbi:MAG: orotidine-5'-phosphate decarboxylase [Acetobacteraceae bacterium]|nr:orotidine-5'-phosphate decarboxylase [Acetobacteraceae bacterium]